MNATTIIAYAADADYWCRECAALTYDRIDDQGILRTIGSTESGREWFYAIDNEGNEVHPVFASDEWWEPSEDGPQTLSCNRCGEILDEIEGEIDHGRRDQ